MAVSVENEFEQKVWASRIVVLSSLFVAIYFHAELDNLTQRGYDYLRGTWWFKHDTFEPVWATISFGLWTDMFMFIDYYCQPVFEKYLINPKGRNPEHTYNQSVHRMVALVYLLPLFIYDYFFPRRVLPAEAPSFFGLLIGVCCSMFFYDLLFFPIHYLLHKGPGWLTTFHRRHHEVSPLVAPEVIRHSFVDGSMQVLSNILVLNVLKLHPLTRALHNLSITYFLTEIHAGYDMPWMLHNLLPKGVLGGPRRHEMHHRTGRFNYHQFFTYLDYLIGSASDFKL